MRLVIVAVGQRQPAWARDAFAEYAKRMPADARLELTEVKAEPRDGGRTAEQAMAAEAQRLRSALPNAAYVVVLDEQGQRRSSAQLAQRLQAWRALGRDVALLIGGPDGLHAALKASADESLRLSDLTLPHALARVLLAEALYRAWSIAAGHPYHRA
ncbi:MAG: 23S rRNA (pseudouridine(1915)-N(3))-methyltransferase RlmH [Burkholderiaceae bacterium]|nr:23S rRNA (pseudouridine(1915)-N(3))-methyltransferase RlmH [Ideonella sp.]MCC7288252.1 23S rRNA (pseudouridine(1915)-N(3))-methyltransferase RlmH [Burkholderiaceae bacterium]